MASEILTPRSILWQHHGCDDAAASRICQSGLGNDEAFVRCEWHSPRIWLWQDDDFPNKLVENHGKLVTTLAKGLSQIADSLPRIELVTILYPTRRVKQAVAELYAYILRFFIRVQEWFEQGKLRHAWEALARPVELRYDDLIEEIEGRTSDIDKLANAGAQAEQRDIHLELQELTRRQAQSDTIMLEMRQSIICQYNPPRLPCLLTVTCSVRIASFQLVS
jgi:hypothetical protein